MQHCRARCPDDAIPAKVFTRKCYRSARLYYAYMSVSIVFICYSAYMFLLLITHCACCCKYNSDSTHFHTHSTVYRYSGSAFLPLYNLDCKRQLNLTYIYIINGPISNLPWWLLYLCTETFMSFIWRLWKNVTNLTLVLLVCQVLKDVWHCEHVLNVVSCWFNISTYIPPYGLIRLVKCIISLCCCCCCPDGTFQPQSSSSLPSE